MTTVDVVLALLESAQYEVLPRPLVVAGSKFDFDAAARGTGTSHDLVVVADAGTDGRRLTRLISGLNRALDQAQSRQPVSLVLIGAGQNGHLATELERHARVLTLDSTELDEDGIRRAIAVLLPLTLPSASALSGNPLEEVASKLGVSLTAEHQQFIDAAQLGQAEVEKTLRGFVDVAASGEQSET